MLRLLVKTKALIFGVALIMAATGGTLAVGASPAGAATSARAACGPSFQDEDPAWDTVVRATQGLAHRTGPTTSCPAYTYISNGTILPLACSRYGDVVHGWNTWTAVYYGGRWGWVSDYYLEGGGAHYFCL